MSNAVATPERRSPGKRKRLMPSPLQLPSNLSAYDREIPARILVQRTASTELAATHHMDYPTAAGRQRSPASDGTVTPAIVISAAVGEVQSISSRSHIFGPQYTPASSVYSQPVRLPSPAYVADTASMPRWAYRIQSQSTVFEEDELSMLDGETDEYEPLSAGAHEKNSWQNSFDSTISTPRRSKGWWNFITSPFSTPTITMGAPSPKSAARDGDGMRKLAILASHAAKTGTQSYTGSQPGIFSPAAAFCAPPEEIFAHGVVDSSPPSLAFRGTTAPLKPGSLSRQPTVPNKYHKNPVNANQRPHVPQTPKSHFRHRAESESTLFEDDKAFSPYSRIHGDTPIVAMASLGTVQTAHNIVKVLHSGIAFAGAGPSMSVHDRVQPNVVPKPSLDQYVTDVTHGPEKPRPHVAEVRRNSFDGPTQDDVGSLFPPYTYGTEPFPSAHDCEKAYEWSRSVTPVRTQEKPRKKLKSGCGRRTCSFKTPSNTQSYSERLFWITGVAIGSGLILLVVLLVMFIFQQ